MLIERLRRALAPDYDILEMIAGGGMGVVFAARHRRLDRKVAIKILRPELATAVAAERFLAEGRLLARLSHPNILPVHDAGEADGLLYYVMEFVEGETLAERLERGPLAPGDALHLARDLLGALSTAHASGVVHRDVKPANVFLRRGRALLGDFGIARWREEQGQRFTLPGELIGTPKYMAPEQRDGAPATARADVYAAGLVLYEASVGKRWPSDQEPEGGEWGRVPAPLVGPLRKALALEPGNRWENAAAFAAELERRPFSRRKLVWLAAPALGALLTWAMWPAAGPPESARGYPLDIATFATRGGASSAEAALGDSVAVLIRRLLSGMPDFDVRAPGERGRSPPAVSVGGAVTVSGSQLEVLAQESGAAAQDHETISVLRRGPTGTWPQLAEAVASELVFKLWQRAERDPFFPERAIPKNPADRARLAKAEQYFSQGRWEEARMAYQALDSTCLLCTLRSIDIGRWFGQPRDSAGLALLRRSEASFPEHYRSLIHAILAPFPARLDTLARVSQRYAGFYLAPFEYADELFHRGPLNGELRANAVEPLRTALRYRPNFAPAREHLTWLLLSDGDSSSAKESLDALLQQPILSGLAAALPTLRKLGFHWRYLSPDSARRYTARLLRTAQIIQYPGAAAGARLLMTMDAPSGAVELGGMFQEWRERADAALPGLLGQLFGYAALGQPDSVRVVGKRFARLGADDSYGLLALELEAVLRSLDPDSALMHGSDLPADLARVAARTAEPQLRRRATWALGLLAARRGDRAAVAAARTPLGDEPPPGMLGRILDAAAAGRADPSGALALLPAIPSLAAELEYPDPLADAVVRLLRADWLQRTERRPEALRTLRWHEHSQILGHLTGPPQAGELAWALGTLARWKRREVLAAMGEENAEWCRVNRAIARIWAGGAPVFQTRAGLARQAARSAACAATL